jgi:hypothetical protein
MLHLATARFTTEHAGGLRLKPLVEALVRNCFFKVGRNWLLMGSFLWYRPGLCQSRFRTG